jgi:hypothetical protein
MPFVEFLRATVLLSAAAATALGAVTVVGAGSKNEPNVALLAFGWWAVAAVIGLVLGRRADTTPPIARLLAAARAATTMPEQRAARILLNRLWPLLVSSLLAGAAGLFAPQVPGIATGFAIIWALAWRHQHRAVEAIEQRDGVRFHVEPTSPFSPISLTRTPGFKAYLPQQHERAA